MNVLRKTLIAGVALATIVASVAATSAPASAKGFGFGWGLAGVATGLAVAAAATPYYAGYNGYYAYDCYRVRQPIYDEYGNYIGSRHIRVCN
jgi:hypothetical protein